MKCGFCEIIAGRAPVYILYESEKVIAFLDINPVTSGHTRVVPREHVMRLDDIKDLSLMQEMMAAMIHLSRRMLNRGICEEFSVLQANGIWANQSIAHVHFHLISRHEGDGVHLHLPTNVQDAKNENLQKFWLLMREENWQ